MPPQVIGALGVPAAYSTPGYVVLYKTVIQPRYRPLYDETGALTDIRALYSPPPSDFSGVKMLICLPPDVEVVEYQASYIRRQAEHTPAGIACLCIPTNEFKTLAGDGEESCVQHLSWPSNDWKELVWYSRTDRTLPLRLSRYEDAALIAGPMAWVPRLAFAALESWEDITDKFLFKVGGNGGLEGRVAVHEVCFRRVWHEGLAGEQGPGNEGVLLCGSRDGLVAGREPFRVLGLNGVNWERQNGWTSSLSCKRNEGHVESLKRLRYYDTSTQAPGMCFSNYVHIEHGLSFVSAKSKRTFSIHWRVRRDYLRPPFTCRGLSRLGAMFPATPLRRAHGRGRQLSWGVAVCCCRLSMPCRIRPGQFKDPCWALSDSRHS